jgi:hypothetical protein
MQYLYDMRLNFGDKAVDNLKTGDRLDVFQTVNSTHG